MLKSFLWWGTDKKLSVLWCGKGKWALFISMEVAWKSRNDHNHCSWYMVSPNIFLTNKEDAANPESYEQPSKDEMFHNYLSFCFQFFQSIMKQWTGTANCVWIGNSTGQSHVSQTPKRFRALTFDSTYMQPLHLLTGQQQDWITVASPSLAAFAILTSPCPTYTGENDWGHPEHFYMTYPNCAEGTNFVYGEIQFHNLQMYFDVWTEGVQLYNHNLPL